MMSYKYFFNFSSLKYKPHTVKAETPDIHAV